MLIGLTGRNGAGKGEVAEFFTKKGFRFYSLSDVIREEIRQHGQSVTRQALVDTGNRLRAEYGHDVLARRVMEKLDGDSHCVIDSIRLPEEVEALRSMSDFIMLSVQAEPEIRFQRVIQRGRESDPQTLEEFLDLERLELAKPGTGRQQLAETEKKADHRIPNNETLEELHRRLELFLGEHQAHQR
ncbi:MAG TPA: AAA family ATPase [Acidobacteriota bacterium]|nr:AAA family ATPase [Acidobacteriota bacterium]